MNSKFYSFLTLLIVGVLFYVAARYLDDQSLRVIAFIMFGASLASFRDAGRRQP